MAYLAAPFKTSGEFPIEDRLVFKTTNEMVTFGKEKYSCMPESYFAVCTEDSNFYVYSKKDHTNTSGGWKKVEGTGSTLESDLLVTTPWGNIKSGTVIPKGTDVSDVLTSALSTYVAPTISVSVPNNSTLYTYPAEGNATATITDMQINATVGTKAITAVAFDTSMNVSFVNWSTYNTTHNKTSAINKTITGNTTLTGWVSDGTLKSGTVKINFALPYYYGVSDTSTIDNVTTGTKKDPTSTSKTSQSNLSFSCGEGKYAWFAYDNSFGNLKSIMQGATDIKSQFTTATAGYNDKTMKVYVTTGLIVDDNTLSFNF